MLVGRRLDSLSGEAELVWKFLLLDKYLGWPVRKRIRADGNRN